MLASVGEARTSRNLPPAEIARCVHVAPRLSLTHSPLALSLPPVSTATYTRFGAFGEVAIEYTAAPIAGSLTTIHVAPPSVERATTPPELMKDAVAVFTISPTNEVGAPALAYSHTPPTLLKRKMPAAPPASTRLLTGSM